MGIRRIDGRYPFGSLDLRHKHGIGPSGAGGFDVLSLSPDLWIDFSDASTWYDAASAGSLVAPDGEGLRVEDKSGNARHATQSTIGKGPTRKTAVQNGLDCARFDGVSEYLATVPFGGSETWTRIVVFASKASQSKAVVAWGSNYYFPLGADYIFIEGASIEISQNTAPGGTISTTTIKRETTGSATVGRWIVAVQSCDGTNAGHVLSVNGEARATTNFYGGSGDPGAFTKIDTPYGIAAYNDGGAPANADIGEIIHINRTLTNDEMNSVIAHEMSKWGIP